MNLVIAELLDLAELEAICAHLERDLAFKSGKSTAGHHARSVKHNEQASAESAAPILAKRLAWCSWCDPRTNATSLLRLVMEETT